MKELDELNSELKSIEDLSKEYYKILKRHNYHYADELNELWTRREKIFIKINQIRLKNWYWKK